MKTLERLDATILDRVEEILKTDERDMQLLTDTVSNLWESAMEASSIHQEILATLENALRAVQEREQGPSADELLVLRMAIHSLKQPKLFPSNAESVRLRFVEAGFPPMAFLD